MNRFVQYIPAPLRRALRSLRRRGRRTRLAAGKHQTRTELAQQFSALGIGARDTILVHSALSKIGFVDGGPRAVIEALLDVVGAEGTLVFPTFPFNTYVADYLTQNPHFDVLTTPSRMGKVTEEFRLRPGSIRSVHPTHPVAACGPQSKYLTESHHLGSSTFGPTSPFYRLTEVGGKILLLGVDLHSMTNLHVVEDTFEGFPYCVYRPDPIQATARDAAGREFPMVVRVHDPEMSQLRDCNRLDRPFEEQGVLRRGAVGQAVVRLLSADGVLRSMVELARTHFTMYDDDRVPERFRHRNSLA